MRARAAAVAASAVAVVAGAWALGGWRPSAPGTREPALARLSSEERAWLERLASSIDPMYLRAAVNSLPGPRNRFDAQSAMSAAEGRISDALSDLGWTVRRRPYTLDNVPAGGAIGDNPRVPAFDHLAGVNIEAVREGRDDRDAVVVITHYDTVAGSVGADDNTAAVVAALELGRLFAVETFRHSVVLLFPDMEERGLFGAYRAVEDLLADRRLLGAICLDPVAFTSRDPGAQAIPAGFGVLYPRQVRRLRRRGSRGDFALAFFDRRARPLATAFAEGMAALAGPDAVMLAPAPHDLPVLGPLLTRTAAVRDPRRSDHAAFWDAGVPAVFISDTANFRYPDYHEPTDTPDRLDYIHLAAIIGATACAVGRRAGRIS